MSLSTRLDLRIIRFLIKRAVRIQETIHQIVYLKIRIEFDLPLPGDDHSIDRKLHHTVSRFFGWHPTSDSQPSEDDNDHHLRWVRGDESCNSLLNSYFRVSHWLSPADSERSDVEAKFRSTFRSDLVPLENSDIWQTYVNLRSELKSLVRLRRESRAVRLKLRLGQAARFLPWFTSALICAGYLHTSIVYRDFGIEPARFFSVGDYLAASLEQISHAFFALLGYLSGAIVGYRNQAMLTKYEIEEYLRKERFERLYWFALGGGGLLIVYFYWDLFVALPFTHVLLVVCLLAATHIPLGIIAGRYFQNADTAHILSAALVIFFGSMYFAAQIRIGEIRNQETGVHFELGKGTKTYTHEDYDIIGSNSRYMFIWDRKGGVEVIAMDALDRIRFLEE